MQIKTNENLAAVVLSGYGYWYYIFVII